MSNYSELIYRLEFHLIAFHVGYTIGKGEELFILLTTVTLALLIAIHLHLCTCYVVERHVFLDLSPLPFLTIAEVHSVVVTKNVLDG